MQALRNVLLYSLLACIVLLPHCHCARILAVLPLFAQSHHIFFRAILEALNLAGHEITVYSPFPREDPLPNYTDHKIEIPLGEGNGYMAIYGAKMQEYFKCLDVLSDVCFKMLDQVFDNEKIQKLLKSNQKFDLVFTEAFTGQEFALIFAHHFNATSITLQASHATPIINSAMRNSLALIDVPYIGYPYTEDMTFWEILESIYATMRVLFYYYSYHLPKVDERLRIRFENMPPIRDLVDNISLTFTNGHLTAHYPQAKTPNIIPLAGVHLNPHERLTEEISHFINGAEHGIIYFSLGSFVPDDYLTDEYFIMYNNVFSRLPQRVLWKTKKSELPVMAPNIMIKTWMPQQAILAHPKCRLFITHGGLLSQHETVHHAIPAIGAPFVTDQHYNMAFYESRGIGISLNLKNLTEELVTKAILTVMSNSKYKDNVEEVSKKFRDQEYDPAKLAVFWTEYVLRHQGAKFVTSPRSHLAWVCEIVFDPIIPLLMAMLYINILATKWIYRKFLLVIKWSWWSIFKVISFLYVAARRFYNGAFLFLGGRKNEPKTFKRHKRIRRPAN